MDRPVQNCVLTKWLKQKLFNNKMELQYSLYHANMYI